VREILTELLEAVTEQPEHNERAWLMSRIRALGAGRGVSPPDA
jgi:hypothetical protein